jgi:integrase
MPSSGTLRVPDLLREYCSGSLRDRSPRRCSSGFNGATGARVRAAALRTVQGAKVTAHGMRGLYSTLAMEAGITGHVVAASLGHEGVSTTVQSYAKPESVVGAQQHRALRVLSGGIGVAQPTCVAFRCACKWFCS